MGDSNLHKETFISILREYIKENVTVIISSLRGEGRGEDAVSPLTESEIPN